MSGSACPSKPTPDGSRQVGGCPLRSRSRIEDSAVLARAHASGSRTRKRTWTMRINVILVATAMIAAAAPALAQQTYPTPEAAMKDLVDSAKDKTSGFGERIFGKDGAALLKSGDADRDAENLDTFNAAAAAHAELLDGPNGTKVLTVGKNGWTLPVPL